MKYFVYIICDISKRLYIGVSENPKERLYYHNTKQGAKFTRSGICSIVLLEEYENLSKAREREIQIKKWRRDKKDFLIKRYKMGLETKNLILAQR